MAYRALTHHHCGHKTRLKIAILLGPLLFVVTMAPPSFAQLSFFQTPTWGSNLPVVVEDFDGDGNQDIFDGRKLFLGNGNGSFHPGVTTGITGTVCASGDFNGDGKPDLLATSPGEDTTFRVALGNGNGTFQAARITNAGAALQSVAAADLNGDGKADVLGVTTSGLLIFLGAGDGTFATGTLYLLPSLGAMVTGDFNNDHKVDVAFAGSGLISIFLGNGDGTLQNPVTGAGASHGLSLLAADFNHDGKLDLAVADGEQTFPFIGNGDGTFQSASPAIPASGQLVASDLDGDGKLDMVISAALAQVFQGNGDGTFVPWYAYNVDLVSYGPSVVADFNNDQKLDLAVGVFLLIGNGNGSFQGEPASAACRVQNNTGSTGDFNGNGTLDIASFSGSSLCIVLNDGRGNLTPGFGYQLPNTGGGAVASSDLNGDGHVDLVVSTDDGIDALLGNGDGTFQAPIVSPGTLGTYSLRVTDVNGDQIPDVLLVSAADAHSQSSLFVYLGNGDGSFSSPASYFAGSGPVAVASADFNSDGKVDAAVVGSAGLAILLGNGDGTFQNATFPSNREARFVTSADLNADGIADLMAGSDVTGSTVFLGKGDGTFTAIIYDSIKGTDAIAADFDGDGRLDLLLVWNSDSASVCLGNGDGTIGNPISIRTWVITYQEERFALVGDFNGDTKPDLAFGVDSPAVSIVLNTSQPIQRLGLAIAPGTSGSATVSPGGTANYTLSIGGQGFSGTAALSCTGAPVGATCSVPANINVDGTEAIEFAVTVTTTAPSNAALYSPQGSSWLWGFAIAGLVVLPAARRSKLSGPRSLAVCAVLLAVAMCGCGGGGSSSHHSPSGGTPRGTYPLTVKATAGSLIESVQLTLTVQ